MSHIYRPFTKTENRSDSKNGRGFRPDFEQHSQNLYDIDITVERLEETLNSPEKGIEKLEHLIDGLYKYFRPLKESNLFQSKYYLNMDRNLRDFHYDKKEKKEYEVSIGNDFMGGTFLGFLGSAGIATYLFLNHFFNDVLIWIGITGLGSISCGYINYKICSHYEEKYLKKYEKKLMNHSKNLINNSKKFLDGLRMK